MWRVRPLFGGLWSDGDRYDYDRWCSLVLWTAGSVITLSLLTLAGLFLKLEARPAQGDDEAVESVRK